MRISTRLTAAFAFASALSAARAAHADPPAFVAHPSLREGLRVDACPTPDRCETWVRFAARPYRTFVEAQMAPSGRFFYVWSKPDGRSREVDVFATPRRGAQLAQRRGHWSPGAGGELTWVTRDRLWHRWSCGSTCSIAQLYDVYGTTLASFVGQDAEVSPNGRFAIVADRGEGTLLDLEQATTRSFHGPDHMSYAWDVDWTERDVSIWFEDEDDDARPNDARRAVQLTLAPAAPEAPAAPPAAPPRATPPRAPAVATIRPPQRASVRAPSAPQPRLAVTRPR